MALKSRLQTLEEQHKSQHAAFHEAHKTLHKLMEGNLEDAQARLRAELAVSGRSEPSSESAHHGIGKSRADCAALFLTDLLSQKEKNSGKLELSSVAG